MRTVTMDEVKAHCVPGDMWIVVDGLVYDISKFAAMHPGGERVMKNYAGKDGTEVFFELHRREILDKYQRLVIAQVQGATKAAEQPLLSQVPYSEMMILQGYKSPYFKESHIAMKKLLRKEMSAMYSECHALDVAGKYPSLELYKKFASTGNLITALGPGPWMRGRVIAGVKGEEFDAFHEMIFHQENARLGSQGFTDGLGGGLGIGLPPVAYFAPAALKKRVLTEVLTGEKRICLAISEPYVGSDVAQIKCTAEKTPCGKYYIVNGEKKWITGGAFADYFVTAVRTGGAGMGGISMLLVPRTEGVRTKQIQTSYSQSAGTAYVMFTDVKVPVENLIGKENKGFMCIMANFNHERWGMIVALAERCRVVIEECFKWAVQRKVFGKPLIKQAVVRQKLAEMASGTESLQHWLDAVTHQMCSMSLQEQTKRLPGIMSLLKYHSTRVSCKVADNAAQIFGGRAVTKSGMGYKVEQFIRNYKFSAILGGSEEVMADFAIRYATKGITKEAKL